MGVCFCPENEKQIQHNSFGNLFLNTVQPHNNIPHLISMLFSIQHSHVMALNWIIWPYSIEVTSLKLCFTYNTLSVSMAIRSQLFKINDIAS